MRTSLLTTLIVAGIPALAWGAGDNFSIESFSIAPKDLTAITEGTMRYDLNGNKAALIKIETTEKGFNFSVGALGIVAVEEQNEEHPAEIWLYVPAGVKKVSIQHPDLGMVRDYDLKQRLKEGKTYIMRLTSDRVNTFVVDYGRTQHVKFEVDPPGAQLIINGVRQQTDTSGKIEMDMAAGRHQYRVEAPLHHPVEGELMLTQPEVIETVAVSLPHAYGLLSIGGGKEETGAMVFIDGEEAGQIPLDARRIASGPHDIRVKKHLYEDWMEHIVVTDSATVVLRPVLGDNFGVVTLLGTAGANDALYIDGRFVGNEKWSGQLEPGTYTLETRREAHRPSNDIFTVAKGGNISITATPPQPIFGTVRITSEPSGADVMIDGHTVGKTPFVTDRELIGEKRISLSKPGYGTDEFTLEVKEGVPVEMVRKLTDISNFRIYTHGATAVLRGKDYYQMLGQSPTVQVPAGYYDLTVFESDHRDYKKRLWIDANTRDMDVKLRRQYLKSGEFYLQAGYSYPMNGVEAAVGAYFSNVNLEIGYEYGFKETETFHWEEGNYKYSPSAWDFRVGYGLKIGGRVRLTPQIGARYITLSEKEGEETVFLQSDMYKDASRISGTASLKLDIALGSALKLVVAPGFSFKLYDNVSYTYLSTLSTMINDCGNGFGGYAGLSLYF